MSMRGIRTPSRILAYYLTAEPSSRVSTRAWDLRPGWPDLHMYMVLMRLAEGSARFVDVVRVDHEPAAVANVLGRPAVRRPDAVTLALVRPEAESCPAQEVGEGVYCRIEPHRRPGAGQVAPIRQHAFVEGDPTARALDAREVECTSLVVTVVRRPFAVPDSLVQDRGDVRLGRVEPASQAIQRDEHTLINVVNPRLMGRVVVVSDAVDRSRLDDDTGSWLRRRDTRPPVAGVGCARRLQLQRAVLDEVAHDRVCLGERERARRLEHRRRDRLELQ